jgi:predicted phosphodiesterase
MRVAIFSDTHGNAIALDAVLADVERVGGVDAYWFVGDAAAIGFDPVGTVRRLVELPGLKAVRGNTDRESARDAEDLEARFLDVAASDPERAGRWFAMLRNFAWTRGALMAAGYLDWLAGLPVEERVELPDGTRVLLVHAAPGTDDGDGIREEQGEADLGEVLEAANADLVIVGHTHLPVERTVNGVRAWNLGSVSVPFTDEKRAMWTLLEADAGGYGLERQYVAYDVAGVLDQLDAIEPPAAGVLRSVLERGG